MVEVCFESIPVVRSYIAFFNMINSGLYLEYSVIIVDKSDDYPATRDDDNASSESASEFPTPYSIALRRFEDLYCHY